MFCVEPGRSLAAQTFLWMNFRFRFSFRLLYLYPQAGLVCCSESFILTCAFSIHTQITDKHMLREST